MLPFDIVHNVRKSSGISLLEILLVISLVGFLYIGIMNFFLESVGLFTGLIDRSDAIHQVRTGIESVVSELQEANPTSVVFLEKDLSSGFFTEVQFNKYGSSDLFWFYLNSTGSLIRGVQRPGKNWGRTTLAIDLDKMYFNESIPGVIQIQLFCEKDRKKISLSTEVSPGF